MPLDIGDTLLTKHLSWMVLYAVKQEIALLQQFLSVHVKQKVRRCSSTLTGIKYGLPDLNLQTAASTVGKLHGIIKQGILNHQKITQRVQIEPKKT